MSAMNFSKHNYRKYALAVAALLAEGVVWAFVCALLGVDGTNYIWAVLVLFAAWTATWPVIVRKTK